MRQRSRAGVVQHHDAPRPIPHRDRPACSRSRWCRGPYRGSPAAPGGFRTHPGGPPPDPNPARPDGPRPKPTPGRRCAGRTSRR
ncbi:hypothetical protein B4N89_31135 [Embleya scabrispora]|uniref:Uncharacterized protein n=1 Tax=Embleya scabrispora TaxID=159449 RepID=A0A1T3NPH2_9ACTN|nr:hypothetical protein B4N89_31135 [Embleya scabrispora]